MQTMIHIPEELLDQAERGNVLLFVGERVVRDASGQVVLDQLTAQLAARGGLVDIGDISFPEAAQIYEDSAGRQALIQFLRDRFEALGDEPQPVHRLIAGLSDCNLLVTTCLDRRLDRAFADAGRPLDVIIGTVDVAFEDERKPRLYRLRGVLDRPESLVLTEDDYETFFEDQSSISIVLQGYLARKTILFVGYDLADAQFKRLYRKVTAPLDDYARRAYAFSTELDPKVSRWCDRHGISVIAVDGAVLLEALAGQLATRIHPKSLAVTRLEQALQLPLPERPYKLLDYYESDDAAIFFGRNEEIQALSSLIHGHRLVLVYGASGVGKTSLLLAGAVTSLEQADPPYQTIYVRALGDPAQIIRDTILRELPEETLPTNGTLVNFLASTTRIIERKLVIVLDQFEEFFIRLSPQFREAFIADLGSIYDARDVPVKIVISLREDWLAAVSQIEQRIPEVFRTKLWLLPLTREQARQAIVAPVERLGVRYEPELVERLLDDLVGTTGVDVMPPQLQLVCSALYAKLGPNERTIALATYEHMGGARGVLRRYLEDELNRLGHDERTLARGALEELVTSQSTKAVKSAQEVALQLDVDPAKLALVLEKLVRARLLRLIERQDGETAFELAHEYLIREIGLGEGAKERKEVEELLGQEVENWQRFQTLLAADKLARIGEVRELLRLSPEAQELLLRSALQVGDEIDYWLWRVSDHERRVAVLVAETRSRLALVRRRAAEVLGTQDVAESVDPLLQLTLRDPDRAVRLAARASLAALVGQRPTIVARLQPELANESRKVRRAAIRTLSTLPLNALPRGLRTRALATRLNLGASWLVEQSVATPVRRAMLVTAALLLVFVAVAYVFSANSYYVDTRPSVPGQNVLVIRRGYPLLKLPGLGQEEVDSGIPEALVANSHWGEVHSEQLAGLWMQRDVRGYDHWFEGVLGALRLEGQASLLWYLKRQDEAFQKLLEAKDVDEPQARRWRAQALGQIAVVDPALANPQGRDELVGLLKDQPLDVRASAAGALGHLATANPALATPQVMDALIELLRDQGYLDQGGPISSYAADAIQQLVKANPALATTRLADELLGQIVHQNVQAQYDAAQVLSDIVHANPTLAPHVIETLEPLLNDSDSSVRINASDTLGRLWGDNRSLATSAMADRLSPLLEDSDSGVRASAVGAMGSLGKANPALATGAMAARVSALLEDPESGVRASAVSAMGDLVAANHALATASLADRLGALLKNRDSTLRYTSLQALGQLAKAPSIAPWATQKIIDLLKDQDQQTRSNAGYMVEQMLNDKVALDTRQVADALIELISSHDDNTVSSAAYTLGSIVRADTALAPHVGKLLTGLLKHPSSRVRASAAATLGEAVTADPLLATPQLTDLLIALLADPDDQVRASAVSTIVQVAVARPTVVPPGVAETLGELLKDQSSTVRVNARIALQNIYTHQISQLGASDDAFFAKLADPLNALERPIAAHVLFSTALNSPARSQTIRRRLLSEPFASSRDPIAQVWANKTLALLDLADLAHSATTHIGQWDSIAAKLEHFSNLDAPYLYYSPDLEQPESLIGNDYISAAGEARDWLVQRAAHEKE